MARGPLVRVPFVPCGYQERCGHHAYIRVSLSGHKAKSKEPVNTCRVHAVKTIDVFLAIAPNSLLIRSTAP